MGKRERQTLQRSSRVLGGEPSRAVFRASTGLYLNGERIKQLRFLAKIKELSSFRENYTKKERIEFECYCLSKLSIFRDFCSILVIMASALSASTNSSVPAIFHTLSLFLFHCDFLICQLEKTWGNIFPRK